jgi:hypothetical protein
VPPPVGILQTKAVIVVALPYGAPARTRCRLHIRKAEMGPHPDRRATLMGLGVAAGTAVLGVNPDRLSHEALAAELTNHLIPDVVLTRAVAIPLLPGGRIPVRDLSCALFDHLSTT